LPPVIWWRGQRSLIILTDLQEKTAKSRIHIQLASAQAIS
jgi:hypothetical protein